MTINTNFSIDTISENRNLTNSSEGALNMENKVEKVKSFKVFAGERPQVLLLGNGIPRAFYEGGTWSDLIEQYIKDPSVFSAEPTSDKYCLPLPLKAEMLSNNKLASRIKKYPQIASLPKKKNHDHKFLQELFKLDFDYFLTTNYTYEVECALLGKYELKDEDIKNMKMEITNKKDALISRFNRVTDLNGKSYDIWHIHGEPVNFRNITLGNEEYGKQIGRYDSWICKRKKEILPNQSFEIRSWVDAFLVGDVYILGLGMDFAETDLWWLLQQKTKTTKNIKNFWGSTTFFEPIIPTTSCYCDLKCRQPENSTNKNNCKIKLFEVFNVKVEHLNKTASNTGDFADFYWLACDSIKKDLAKKKRKNNDGISVNLQPTI